MMRSTITILLTGALALTACKNSDNSAITDSNSITKINSQPVDSINKTDNKKEEELIKKWTWNDKLSKPLKSSISNSEISSNLLFKTWTWADNTEKQPVLTFKKDSLNIHAEKKYIYTINFDSLRIFTSYDHSGDGFTRGIITKLTKDSLVIKWSTEDVNKYVPIDSK